MCLTPDPPPIQQVVAPPPAEAPAPLASPYALDEVHAGLSGLRVNTRGGLKARARTGPEAPAAAPAGPPAPAAGEVASPSLRIPPRSTRPNTP